MNGGAFLITIKKVNKIQTYNAFCNGVGFRIKPRYFMGHYKEVKI